MGLRLQQTGVKIAAQRAAAPGVAEEWLLSMSAVLACRQWTFPLQLPPQLLGIFSEGTLQDNDRAAPWSADIEQKVFDSYIGALRQAVPPAPLLQHCSRS